jgi:hypothetical protein
MQRDDDVRELVEQVRRAVVEAGMAAWEEASLAGLCGEGAWEVAVGRMREVDLDALGRDRRGGATARRGP